MMRWFSESWFSCSKFSIRSSQHLDGQLPWRERPGYLFHYYWCLCCRRFERQVRLIEAVLKKLNNMLQSEQDGESSQNLSEEANARIKAALKKTEE